MRRVPKGALVVAVLALVLFVAPRAYANACVSNATGNWNAPGTWTACGGSIPTAADTVDIGNLLGHTVTVNVSNAVAASVQVGNTLGAGTLVFSSGSQVTVSGALTIGGFVGNGTVTMTSGGTLILRGIAVGGGLGSKTWTPGTGTVELT